MCRELGGRRAIKQTCLVCALEQAHAVGLACVRGLAVHGVNQALKKVLEQSLE